MVNAVRRSSTGAFPMIEGSRPIRIAVSHEARVVRRAFALGLALAVSLPIGSGVTASPGNEPDVPRAAPDAENRRLAFPGAEGFGRFAQGGRGGRVILVTTLDDYGPRDEPIEGSLRAACDAGGPRMVLFRVSGTIDLRSTLRIREPFVTVAGQSAPGGGICLRNLGVVIDTHDVILRHLRLRPGDRSRRELDALSINAGSRDVIVDHCSASWGTDEVLSVSGADITDVTVQWCFITEGLDESVHSKGRHGYGSLIRTNGHVTFHHNLYAHHRSRSPRPGTYGEGSILLDFRNNVIHRGGRGYASDDPARLNYVGNYIRDAIPFVATDTTCMYVAGNVLHGEETEGGVIVRGLRDVNRRAEPFPVAPVATDDAKTAFEKVVASAGATLPRRDAVDLRIARQVREGTGKVIDSQDDVGGWPELESAEALPDRDRDDMPDGWEREHRLDLDDPSDAAEDRDGDGYTNLEEFLEGSAP